MILQSKKVNDVVQAIILPNEANIMNAEEFKSEVIQLLEEGNKIVILSFENVDYVDSSFLGSMVAALKFAIQNQAEIYLVNLNKDISNLLTLIRIDKVFKIYKNTEDAMKAI